MARIWKKVVTEGFLEAVSRTWEGPKGERIRSRGQDKRWMRKARRVPKFGAKGMRLGPWVAGEPQGHMNKRI